MILIVQLADLNRGYPGTEVLRSPRDDDGATAPAPKMDEVVRAHFFFLSERDEADFASNCISMRFLRYLVLKSVRRQDQSIPDFSLFNIISSKL